MGFQDRKLTGRNHSDILATEDLRDEYRRYTHGSEFEQKQGMPPTDVRDAQADRAMSGGFKTQASNICADCNETRSLNGTCSCIAAPAALARSKKAPRLSRYTPYGTDSSKRADIVAQYIRER